MAARHVREKGGAQQDHDQGKQAQLVPLHAPRRGHQRCEPEGQRAGVGGGVHRDSAGIQWQPVAAKRLHKRITEGEEEAKQHCVIGEEEELEVENDCEEAEAIAVAVADYANSVTPESADEAYHSDEARPCYNESAAAVKQRVTDRQVNTWREKVHFYHTATVQHLTAATAVAVTEDNVVIRFIRHHQARAFAQREDSRGEPVSGGNDRGSLR